MQNDACADFDTFNKGEGVNVILDISNKATDLFCRKKTIFDTNSYPKESIHCFYFCLKKLFKRLSLQKKNKDGVTEEEEISKSTHC